MRRIKSHIKLKEIITLSQAKSIIKKYNSSFNDWTNEKELNKLRRQLAVKYHPDKGNDPNIMRDINEAIDLLISNSSSDSSYSEPSYSSSGPSYSRKKPSYYSYSDESENYYKTKQDTSNYTEDQLYKGIPIWAWAGYSGGLPPSWNETIPYYLLKKKAWELLGSPNKKNVTSRNNVTFTVFDGRYGRDIITLLSDINNYELLKDVCPHFIKWADFNPKAIIMYNEDSNQDNNYIVAPVNNKIVSDTSEWFTLGSESFNMNPFNDEYFVIELKDRLNTN